MALTVAQLFLNDSKVYFTSNFGGIKFNVNWLFDEEKKRKWKKKSNCQNSKSVIIIVLKTTENIP